MVNKKQQMLLLIMTKQNSVRYNTK